MSFGPWEKRIMSQSLASMALIYAWSTKERCQKQDVERALPFQTNLSPTGKLASAGSDFLTHGDEMLGEWSENKETEMAIEEKKRER